MVQKPMLLIFNPHSGRGDFAINLFEVVDKFTKSGFLVTTYPTQKPGDAREFIVAHCAEFEYLVCSGGDGTLSEVVNALMEMPCTIRPVVGYIPSGTTNDFASSLGLPKDVLEAASVVTDGTKKALDIGQFENRYFSYVAAFGLFTDVSYATPQSKKNVLGHLAYLLEGVKRLGSIESFHCTVQLGADKIEGDFIFGMVTNSLSVGGMKLANIRDICMDDGLFEVVLLQKSTSLSDLQAVIASLIGQTPYTDSLIIRRVSEVTISCDVALPWTLDGEFGGEKHEITIRNKHKAVEIMMPTHNLPTAK